jgi:hypothetical protein
MPPSEEFAQVAAGGVFSCGVRKSDKRVFCWGDPKNDEIRHTDDAVGRATGKGMIRRLPPTHQVSGLPDPAGDPKIAWNADRLPKLWHTRPHVFGSAPNL